MDKAVADPVPGSQAESLVETVIFDGDDTLWGTEPLYDRARLAARQIVEACGFDGKTWEELERRIDVDNVALMGLSASRFPTSCRQAYEHLAITVAGDIDPAIANAVEAAAAMVFAEIAPLMPDAERVVHELSRGFRLVLFTQGDEAIQRKRIEDSGLARYFRDVVVVPKKNVEVLNSVLTRLKIAKHMAWFVGNSIRSDIHPALQAGLRAIWIDAHVWEYEKVATELENPNLHVAVDLIGALKLLANREGPSHT